MNKKILVISSSPRNGNSDILCDEFIKGAKESGNNVEKIRLAEKNIDFAKTCETCCKNEVCSCNQKDDVAEIIQKMIDVDVIVLATPTYFHGMAAQLKALIDRTVERYKEISNKEFYYIVTAADTRDAAIERVVDQLKGFTVCCLNNPIEKGTVYGTGAWQVGDIRNNKKAMEQAYKFGKNA